MQDRRDLVVGGIGGLHRVVSLPTKLRGPLAHHAGQSLTQLTEGVRDAPQIGMRWSQQPGEALAASAGDHGHAGLR